MQRKPVAGMMAGGFKTAGLQNRRLGGTGEPCVKQGADKPVVVKTLPERVEQRRGLVGQF
jgi:hypothetical protein